VGVSLSHYLGFQFNWNICLNGILWILGITLSSAYFFVYFESPYEFERRIKKDEEDRDRKMINYANTRQLYLIIGISILAVSLIPLVKIMTYRDINIILVSFLSMYLGLTFLVNIFPQTFSRTGFLEFIKAIIIANVLPAIGYILQTNEMHRFLLFLTLPLMFIFYALMITLTLQACEKSEIVSKNSIISSMGIKAIGDFHNLLVVSGYVLMLFMLSVVKIPNDLLWPQLITLPLGMLQIWQIRQIRKGGKLAISPLVLNALATSGLAEYFLLLTLWY